MGGLNPRRLDDVSLLQSSGSFCHVATEREHLHTLLFCLFCLSQDGEHSARQEHKPLFQDEDGEHSERQEHHGLASASSLFIKALSTLHASAVINNIIGKV